MTDRLIISGLPGGVVSVSYRREGEDDAQVCGEPAAFGAPVSTTDLADLTWYLERYLLAPYAVFAERGAGIEAKLRDWGEALFGSLFGPGKPARDAYQRARERQAELLIRSAAPGFLSLPWELLKDPERPTPLALDLRGVSRNCQVAGSLIDVPGGEALRLLMVISRPAGLADVDFQMVARPLHERLQAVRGEVRLDVCRPPTLAALEAQLNAACDAGAPYHVLHFDGHGMFAQGHGVPGMFDLPGADGAGILLFENEAGDAGQRVSAGDFAQVVKRGRVPLVILNACQSASLDGAASTTGATVATRLLEEGVRSVVAMSHSVYAVAAAEFMAAFYDALFQGRSVTEATTAGRRQLSRNPERPSPKGEVALQDWIVPVLYSRADLRFPQFAPKPAALQRSVEQALGDLRDGAPGGAADGAAIAEGIEAAEGVFVGRGAEFYTLELAARLQRVVVLHGPAGIGKTELAKGFARWWRDTGGVEKPAWVFFHSFEPGLASFGLDGVLSAIASRILSSEQLARLLPGEQLARLLPGELRPLLVWLLREHAMLLVWDNFESVASMADPTGTTPALDEAGRAEIVDFLAKIAESGGKSAVLITSRTGEEWLGSVRRVEVGQLAEREAAEYARRLLAPWPRGRTRPKQDREGYEALMDWLAGHPLSMKLILPHLETRSARDLLAGLQGQGPLPPDFEGEGRTQSLGASIRYSLDHIDDGTRKLLPALSLFESVVVSDVLGIMSDQPGCPAPFAGVSSERWGNALDNAAHLGLLSALGAGVYRLHPALPAYLAAEWRRDAGDGYETEHTAVLDVLVTAHAALGAWLVEQINSGDARLAFGLVELQRRTMGLMASRALGTGRHGLAEGILQPLFLYFEVRGLTDELRRWIDRCLDATETRDGKAPALDGEAGALWLFAKGYAAIVPLRAHELDNAERIYRSILASLEAAPQSTTRDERVAVVYHQLGAVALARGKLDEAEDWHRKSLAIFEALGDRPDMATSYHQLGRVVEERGKLDEAEDWYRKSLVIKEALGDRRGMAPSYHQLGRVAEERGKLDDAEDWYRKSLVIKEALGDRRGMAPSYHQLGMVAQKRGKLEDAEDWYRKSLAITEALGDHPGMASSYHQLGALAQKRGKLDDAEDWYWKSLTIFEALGDRPHMAASYHQLGMVAQERGKLDDAEDWYWKSLTIFEALGDRPHMASSYHQLGMVAQKRGKVEDAEDWCRKSLTITEALGDHPGMAKTYGQLGLLAETRDDGPAALQWIIRCVMLFDEFGHHATGPAPHHLARLTAKYGEPAFAAAWQEVTGQAVPDNLIMNLRKISDKTRYDDEE